MVKPAQVVTLAAIIIINAWLLVKTAEASASGFLDGIRGILILLAFVAEGLVLYWNQRLFRGKPK